LSPILVRPVREQLEHDRVIRLLQAKLKRKHDVAVNVADEQSAAEETPPIPDELPTEAAAAGTPADEVAEIEAVEETTADELLDEGLPGEELDEEVDEIDEHTGPLLAPALGAEDVTRTEDDRTVRPEIRGSRRQDSSGSRSSVASVIATNSSRAHSSRSRPSRRRRSSAASGSRCSTSSRA